MVSSNLLEDKVKSIIALEMNELVINSRDIFPYSNIWVKEESVFSNNF